MPKTKEQINSEAINEAPKEPGKDRAYTAADIYVLEGLDPVRKRPAMYIGSTGPDGLHHLVWEVYDNAADEAMAGRCYNIGVTLLPNNRVMISDDGAGIPVEKHPQTKKSALETVITTLHAGAKFGSKAYQISGGLHGVGVSVVCALSKWMRAEVSRGGFKYAQEYAKGKVKTPVKKIGTSIKTGTTIYFEPDEEIFRETRFDIKRITDHLRHQAYLTKATRITISDEREGEKKRYTFYFEGGLAAYVKYLTRNARPIQSSIFYCSATKNDIIVEAALQYTEEYECSEESFANHIVTPEGGTHLTGFRTALTRSFNDYARKEGILKEKDENLTGDDIREGFTGVVSVKIKDPQFEGQTKAKLGNAEAKLAVDSVVSEALTDYLERNPQDARSIIEKCLLASKARKAAKAARETVLRKGILAGLTLPGKLADCASRNPEESELFIVEGESAGGCWFGKTKIALTDGRNISFEELVREDEQGKKNFCYTIQSNKHIGVAPILNPRMTKKNAEVIKIILDNGEELVCTPDHRFMLKDSNYKMAQDLKPGDSLMPLRQMVSRSIKGIAKKNEKIDVFDLEVEGTHNFALAAGVFVHNSGKQARDRHFQAILPLRGKILNVEKARLDKLLDSKEIKNLIIALGTAISDDFDLSKIRYHRVIIMTDADVDGAHIRTLLLTLFYRYLKPIIEGGYLYIAQPPLYRIQAGKQVQYAYTEEDRAEIMGAIKGSIGVGMQRYKGLGEMNPIQLWETTMNPENRVLLKVNIRDAQEADKIFDVLMGEEVLPRKRFIQTHAKKVKNLDV